MSDEHEIADFANRDEYQEDYAKPPDGLADWDALVASIERIHIRERALTEAVNMIELTDISYWTRPESARLGADAVIALAERFAAWITSGAEHE